MQKSALAEAASCSASVIDTLVDEGTCEAVALPPEPVALPCDPDFAPPALEPDQARAAAALTVVLAEHDFSVTLLEGVTGSGKTEVYFEAVAAALREGRQTLILMPEIALTAQFFNRFAARFGTTAGGMAFLRQPAQTRAHLGGACVWRDQSRRRRALGVVSALRRSRAHRRR